MEQILNKKKTRLTNKKRNAMYGYIFISPWFIGFLLLVAYPLVNIIYTSFNIVTFHMEQGMNYKWVGLNNFKRVLRVDIDFVLQVQEFITKVLLYVPVIMVLSIIVALILNQEIKAKGIFRLIFFIPIIILNGKLMQNMSDFGGMGIQLTRFIFDIINVVAPEALADIIELLFETIVEVLWYCGVPILIFLATLQKVDKSLYEAAAIDGANGWSIFWKIILPILYPVVGVSILFSVVFLGNFDGNPINGLIVAARNDKARGPGYASAMAISYTVFQLLIIGILVLLTRDRSNKKRRA